jgi:hypothetical protein
MIQVLVPGTGNCVGQYWSTALVPVTTGTVQVHCSKKFISDISEYKYSLLNLLCVFVCVFVCLLRCMTTLGYCIL